MGRRSGWFRAALFHYGRFLGNGNAVLRAVRSALNAQPNERILDVGCGTGGFCLAAPGEYVGIDTDPDYIAFARWRFGSPRRRFEELDLAALDVGAGFDGAILVSCLHHLSDPESAILLAKLAQCIRRRFVVADLDPESSNWFQSIFLRYDRGRFIRPFAAQRTLLAQHFRVVTDARIRNTPHTAVHSLFVCDLKR